MIDTEIMPDGSEIIHYNYPDIPLYIRTSRLSDYPDMQALCHWHDDIEFIHVFEGELDYYINGAAIRLCKNDSLMVNSRQMHYGYSVRGQDCHFSCILLNAGLDYLYFNPKEEPGAEIAELLSKTALLENSIEKACELEAVGILHILWSKILRYKKILPTPGSQAPPTDLEIQKCMVSYIYQHYGERITLADIAASGHVCRNKCCLIFKHYLQQSPVEFLNAYRLKAAHSLLIHTDKSITDIAYTCGFQHLSYFSKLFQECYGCTPKAYRKKHT